MTMMPTLVATAMAAALPIALVQNRGLVPLAVLAAAAVLLTMRQRIIAGFGGLDRGLWLALAALVLWAGLSSLWAIGPTAALIAAARIAALLACLAVLAAGFSAASPAQCRAVALGGVIGLGLGTALLGIELAADAPLNNALRGFPTPPRTAEGTKPAATLAAVLFAPALLAALRLGGLRAAALVSLSAAVVLASTSEAARLGLVAALIAGGIAFAMPGIVRRVLPWALALAVLAGPVLLDQAGRLATSAGLLPTSPVHRVLIWDYAAERAAERPIFGWGMDAARALPGGRDNPDAVRLDRLGVRDPVRAFFIGAPRGAAELIPLHTHSIPLQIRLELGFVGLGLLCAAAFSAGRSVAALAGRGPLAAGTALASATLAVSLLSYGAWQHWWWITVALGGLMLATAASLPALTEKHAR